jgi:Ca-activated chloride channel family protein
MIAAFFEANGWRLLDPWFLLVLPAALVVLLWRARRERAALPAAGYALLRGLPATLRSRCTPLPRWGKVLACACLALALARPVRREPLPLEEDGVDILLVVDISSSMMLNDVDEAGKLRRVDAARARAQEFARKRTTDRVGLLTFSAVAELRCPPTLDEDALAAFLGAIDHVEQGSELDGTAIGNAVAKAAKVLEPSKAKSKVVVLLTDGQNTRGPILPEEGAKLAKDAGIKVYTIGLGHGEPTFGGFRPLDFGELRKVAESTGGQFFTAKTDADLAGVYAEIDRLEKVQLADPRYRMVDGFAWPLGAGLVVLLATFLLECCWLREVP